jgi:LacI family transcriptional regulator
MDHMPVTIRDIAKKLGLSIGAVSRALDGYPDISAETRHKVVQAAAEMGYVPNQAARQLRRKKADAVGYILPANTPRFADPFFTEFLTGLGDETAVQPFDLLISIAAPGAEAERQIYRNWVQGHKVDGLILTHMHLHDWRAQFLSENRVPFSALEKPLDDLDFARIEVNRREGMMELIAHLVAKGFRKIAYLGGPSDLKIQADQFDGYRLGLEAVGLGLEQHWIASGDLTASSGFQAAKHLLSIPDPPDAIVCINDETAFGVLHAAHEMGLKIGQNFAVAGFDGVQASQHTEPALTSLDIPVYDVARQLVKMLVAEISGQPLTERRVSLHPRLLVRASSGG